MNHPAIFGQTIQVVDRSGKVVSNSKHLLNVFKEARAAYRERKAEITAQRRAGERRASGPPRPYAYTIEDDRSSVTLRASNSHRRPEPARRSSLSSARSDISSIYPASHNRFEHDLGHPSPRLSRSVTSSPRSPRAPISPRPSHSPRSPHSPRSSYSPHSPRQELARRYTSMDAKDVELSIRPRHTRAMSTDAYDPDLAYGELPPDLVVARTGDEAEVKGLVSRVKMLLEEADCVQHSVTATIGNLQKNPEAMAAVALTLAEISNIITKLSPGIVMSLRSSAPAVFALLASPQFLIAAGVGVGVTIIAFGGFKIIKRIQAKKAEEKVEMLELGSDVSRIDSWRRGIAEVEASSVGTSVDGEFITPKAANLSRLNLHEERIRESQREARGLKSAKGATPSRTKGSSKSSKSSRTLVAGKEKEGKKEVKKEKKLSPLRLMFR